MAAYYNEIEPFAAQWLRNLIDAGHLPVGDVDERSIVEVQPEDVRGYVQCHWFAGLGGWPHAARLAGWPDDRPLWSGSCPCQPFARANPARTGTADHRHLWPAWRPLIAAQRPPLVVGEQVVDAVAWGWLDEVADDLEADGYACGTLTVPAYAAGANHLRHRIIFAAHPRQEGLSLPERQAVCGARRRQEGATAPGALRRPARPNVGPVSHGLRTGLGRIRAAGNAIDPILGAQVLAAWMDCAP